MKSMIYSKIISKLKEADLLIDSVSKDKFRLLVVGGFAFARFSENRLTSDIDVVAGKSEQKIIDVMASLTDLDINSSVLNGQIGEVYSQAMKHIDYDSAIEFKNFDLVFPTNEFLLVSKFFDTRGAIEDINMIANSRMPLNKDIVIKIIHDTLNEAKHRAVLEGWYRNNRLSIVEAFRARKWDKDDIPNI